MIEELLVEEEEEKSTDDLRCSFLAVEKLTAKYAIGQAAIIRGMLLAVLAREHMILVGPWGCNKTALINVVTHLIGANGSTFLATLDKYSPPDALLGPISAKALKEEDKFKRNMTGMLPEAQFAFIGEVFRGSSAVRGALHSAINERYVDNGGERVYIPLRTMFCDSNSYPIRDEDKPFYDRLLLRSHVDYVGSSHSGDFLRMLKSKELNRSRSKPKMTLDDVDAACKCVQAIPIPEGVFGMVSEIRNALQMSEQVISDRRWKRSLGVLQAQAFLSGRQEVAPPDLLALAYVLWDVPQQRDKVNEVLDAYKAQTIVANDADRMSQAQAIYEDAVAQFAKEQDPSAAAAALATLGEVCDGVTEEDDRNSVLQFISELEAMLTGGSSYGQGSDPDDTIPF